MFAMLKTMVSRSLADARQTAWYYLHELWQKDADSRTVHLPLVTENIVTVLVIMSCYLVFCTLLGPRLMQNRAPLKLKRPLLAYNTIMVFFNIYFFIYVLSLKRFYRDFFSWQFPDPGDRRPETLAVINTLWLYWITKFFDLFDTIAFVLRKKDKQISALHLYHHTMVPIFGWLALKVVPVSTPVLFFTCINSLIHIIMYSYYALAAFGPAMKKFLWWKRYLTQLQLAQFVAFFVYAVCLARNQTGYPPILFWFMFVQNPLFFALFLNFYLKSYRKKAD